MKIVIALNANKAIAVEAALQLQTICQRQGVAYAFFEKYEHIDTSGHLDTVGATLLVTVGGDGTILHAAKNTTLPILGVNLGRVGLLCEVPVGQMESALVAVREGKYHMETRTMVRATYQGQTHDALNDMVLYKAGRKLVDFETRLQKESTHKKGKNTDDLLGVVRADGVIVCTPTGSTAYSVASGGSVFVASAGVLGLTPIGAGNLSNRPVVVGDDHQIQMTPKNQAALMECDGHRVASVPAGESVVFAKSPKLVQFVRLDSNAVYERINAKMGVWCV